MLNRHDRTPPTARPFRPTGLEPAVRARIAPVLALVARARRRLLLHRAARRLGTAAVLALLLAAPLIVLLRLGLWPAAWDRGLLLGALAAAALTLGWALLGRRPWLAVAQRLDEGSQSGDRLSTALWLAGEGRSDPWAEVQAQAAARWAGELDLGRLLPWRWPRYARLWPGAVLLVILALLLPLAGLGPDTGRAPALGLAGGIPKAPAGFRSAAALLGRDPLELVETDARVLREIEEQVTDPQTRQWLTDVREVLEGVADGSLDKQQALERLAELEAQRPKSPDLDKLLAQPDPAAAPPAENGAASADEAQQQKDLAVRNAILDAAKEAAKVAPQETREAIEKAVADKDLDALAKLAEKLAEKKWSDADLEKLVKAVEKFANALKDRKIPDKFKELAQRIDRLQKKRAAEGGLNQGDQERLQKARHDLQQLRRDHGDAQAAESHVQRLERGARAAADALRREQENQQRLGRKGEGQGQPQGGGQGQQAGGQGQQQGGGTREQLQKQMRTAADVLRRESEQQKSNQASRMGQARLRELREALERAGQDEPARRAFERQARGEQDEAQGEQGEPQPGQSRLARREKGERGEQKGGSQGQAGESEAGDAGGQDGQRQGKRRPRFRLGQGDLGDKSRMEQMREGSGPGSSDGGRSQGQGGEGEATGEGMGSGRGQHGQGPESGRLAGGERKQLQGVHGEGPDVKKVFVDAARKGFARQGWREIYAEYSEVAEEMLDKEQLPAGRRAAVKRYFELVRPRPSPAN